MKTDKQLKQINKLVTETKMKIDRNKADLSVILIEFVEKYNKIWEELK